MKSSLRRCVPNTTITFLACVFLVAIMLYSASIAPLSCVANESFIIDNTITFVAQSSGMGDKLLETVGAIVFCHFSDMRLNIVLNENVQLWPHGKNHYSVSLFDFSRLTPNPVAHVVDQLHELESIRKRIISHASGISLAPFFVHRALIKSRSKLTFKEVSLMYSTFAKNILPSEEISQYLPSELQSAYGIHLRRTDKIVEEEKSSFHENTIDEFNYIIELMLEDVENIIITESTPFFYLCSEDLDWKLEIKSKIDSISKKHGNVAMFVETPSIQPQHFNVLGFLPVLDLFALSKCKKIFQGCKHSGFSILASMIGEKPLVNYAHHLSACQKNICNVDVWKSTALINSRYDYEIDHQDTMMKEFLPFEVI